MKKMIIIIVAAALMLSLAACTAGVKSNITVTTLPSVDPNATPKPTDVSSESPTDITSPTAETSVGPMDSASPTSEPTDEPSPAATYTDFVAETPDDAGSGDTMFDIYEMMAQVDLDGDGTDEQIEFLAGGDKSTVYINGTAHTINVSGPAQTFAVTDVDKSDNYRELVFTDKYNSVLADTEFANSYVYWWDGSKLASMGSLMDVKFAGSWRGDFTAARYFAGNGEVYCLAHTTELTDIWYMKTLMPDGTSRKFKEILGDNAAKPVGTPGLLTLKAGKKCLLLAHCTSKFFGNSDMWNYTKNPHNAGRLKNPTEDIIIIAQGGETLEIVGVLGPNWIKLKTSDGYKGWIKVSQGKVLGYNIAPADLFDGIIVAG